MSMFVIQLLINVFMFTSLLRPTDMLNMTVHFINLLPLKTRRDITVYHVCLTLLLIARFVVLYSIICIMVLSEYYQSCMEHEQSAATFNDTSLSSDIKEPHQVFNQESNQDTIKDKNESIAVESVAINVGVDDHPQKSSVINTPITHDAHIEYETIQGLGHDDNIALDDITIHDDNTTTQVLAYADTTQVLADTSSISVSSYEDVVQNTPEWNPIERDRIQFKTIEPVIVDNSHDLLSSQIITLDPAYSKPQSIEPYHIAEEEEEEHHPIDTMTPPNLSESTTSSTSMSSSSKATGKSSGISKFKETLQKIGFSKSHHKDSTSPTSDTKKTEHNFLRALSIRPNKKKPITTAVHSQPTKTTPTPLTTTANIQPKRSFSTRIKNKLKMSKK